jgi:type VI secretion system protein ImpA
MLAPEEVERLLSPLADETPAGPSLRFDPVYEKLREARREDDASLPRGVWERPLKAADHAATAALAGDALARRSKDLQIAAWLADAWVELHGLEGATRGLDLVQGLCNRFWEGLHPVLDEDGDEARGGVLSWLDEALARRLRGVALGGERGTITLRDWDRAASPPAEEENAPTRESLLARLSLVGATRWASVEDDVETARHALARLDEELDARMSAPVRLRRLEATLRDLGALAGELLQASGGRAPSAPATERASEAAAKAASLGPAGVSNGPIQSRAEAYRRLAEAAEFLLRTEPHSPVPYLVQRAIGWGNMSLGELLQEFINSPDDLVVTHRLLGMRRRED